MNVRFVHLADTHLGLSAYNRVDPETGMNLREKQIYDNFLEGIRQIAEIKNLDAVIHAGDLFHYVKPKTVALTVALEALDILEEANIPFVGIAGNHSMPKTRFIKSPFNVLDYHPGPHIFAYSNEYCWPTIGDTQLHLIPNMLTPTQNQIEFQKVKEHRDDNHEHILVMHGLAPGVAKLHTVAEQEIVDEMLEGFDYVALGHIHGQQEIQPGVWYAGSQEFCTYGEIKDIKGGLLVDVEKGEPAKVNPLNLPHTPMIETRTVNCRNLNGQEIIDSILGVFDSWRPANVSDYMMQIPLVNIARDTARTMDMTLLRDIQSHCLNLKIKMTFLEDEVKDVSVEHKNVRGINYDTEFRSYVATKSLTPQMATAVSEKGAAVIRKVVAERKEDQHAN